MLSTKILIVSKKEKNNLDEQKAIQATNQTRFTTHSQKTGQIARYDIALAMRKAVL